VSYLVGATSTGVSALIGVIVGSLITIGGQFIVEVQKRRTAKRDLSRTARGVARLAWNEFWCTQGTLRLALTSGRWWTLNEQPRSELSSDDRRLLADVVDRPQWSEITRSWRRLDRLRWDREHIEASGRQLDLSDRERQLLEDAADSCVRANEALRPLARFGAEVKFGPSHLPRINSSN
jgi:hypothetical protein